MLLPESTQYSLAVQGRTRHHVTFPSREHHFRSPCGRGNKISSFLHNICQSSILTVLPVALQGSKTWGLFIIFFEKCVHICSRPVSKSAYHPIVQHHYRAASCSSPISTSALHYIRGSYRKS